MKYEDIKDFYERCETHPDHQTGMISYRMIERRLQEEIEELREYIEQRDRLAQPEQEPVMFLNNQPLYITPPQRQWVGLADEEIHDCFQQGHKDKAKERRLIAKAIEAKLKEKNT